MQLLAIKVWCYNRPQPRGTYGRGIRLRVALPSIRPPPEAIETEAISGTIHQLHDYSR